MPNVSKIVRILMARDDINQQQLASHLGYNKSVITKALKDDRSWTVPDISAMAELFDVSAGIFFEDADSLIRNRWHSQLVAA